MLVHQKQKDGPVNSSRSHIYEVPGTAKVKRIAYDHYVANLEMAVYRNDRG